MFSNDILQGTFEERAKQFVKESKDNPDWALNLLLTLSAKLRERTQLPKTDDNYFKPSSFGNYFKPLKKLLDTNRVPLVWETIYATYPEQNDSNKSLGYSRQDIQKMLKFSKGIMDKAIILVSASSGIRRGGLVGLKWKDIRPVYQYQNKLLWDDADITEPVTNDGKIVCGMILIYRGSNESYIAFITPETYGAVMDYRKSWIQDVGQEPKPNEPLFKLEGDLPRPITNGAIGARIDEILKHAEIRGLLSKGERRHNIPLMNGFRRFFEKRIYEVQVNDSNLASLVRKERLMGHDGLVKLNKNYFENNVIELINEYLTVVPELTIDDSERLILQGKIKDEKIKSLESEKDLKMREMEEKLQWIESEVKARNIHYLMEPKPITEEQLEKFRKAGIPIEVRS